MANHINLDQTTPKFCVCMFFFLILVSTLVIKIKYMCSIVHIFNPIIPSELIYLNSLDRSIFIRRDVLHTVNPFMPSELIYLNSLDRSISIRRGVWLVSIITMFIEIPVFYCKQ